MLTSFIEHLRVIICFISLRILLIKLTRLPRTYEGKTLATDQPNGLFLLSFYFLLFLFNLISSNTYFLHAILQLKKVILTKR